MRQFYRASESNMVFYDCWKHREGCDSGTGLLPYTYPPLSVILFVASNSPPVRMTIVLDGIPIQPLYTGHVSWWVDYSQGIRLIYCKIKVNGKWMDYTDVLKDTRLQKLLCDEEYCDFFSLPILKSKIYICPSTKPGLCLML